MTGRSSAAAVLRRWSALRAIPAPRGVRRSRDRAFYCLAAPRPLWRVLGPPVAESIAIPSPLWHSLAVARSQEAPECVQVLFFMLDLLIELVQFFLALADGLSQRFQLVLRCSDLLTDSFVLSLGIHFP